MSFNMSLTLPVESRHAVHVLNVKRQWGKLCSTIYKPCMEVRVEASSSMDERCSVVWVQS